MLSIGEGELALVISVQLFHDHAAGTEHAPWQWHMRTTDQWNYATTRDTHAPWQWHKRTTDQWNYATTRDKHAPWQWHKRTTDQWNYATTRDTHAPWQWHKRTADQWNYATTRDTYKSPKQVNTVQFSVINTTYFCQAEYHWYRPYQQ